MAKYSLIRDFASGSNIGVLPFDLSDTPDAQILDHVETNPAWVMAVVRWKFVTTFSRAAAGSDPVISNSNLGDILDILVIDNDCVSMRVDGSKENFSPTLSAVLVPNKDYLKEIVADDWVLAWIVNSEAEAADLVSRINLREPVNKFMDGLKFLGRVNSIRENCQVNEEAGIKTLRYSLNASAFKEFNSIVFYNQYLAENFPSIGEYLAALGTSLTAVLNANGEGVDSNLILPEIIEILLGRGVSSRFSSPGGVQVAAGGTQSTDTSNSSEPQYAYVVPAEVAMLLGQDQSNRVSGVFSFADLLDVVIGIQRYEVAGGGGPETLFVPDGVFFGSSVGNRVQTNPLLGLFLPQAVSFTDNSVWTILNQFLNPAVNEMYVSLKVNGTGSVAPTLTVRQLPFSTPIGVEAAADLDTILTPFLELPRWHLHPILVKSYDRGRTGAVRTNFVMTTGQDVYMTAENTPAEQTLRAPPVRDDMDAKRNGLHPYQVNVACSHDDTFGGAGPKKWQRILADFLMNQELTLNGTWVTVGIQAPIAVGDNLEYGGVVYHIEGVSHQCDISPIGRRRFVTSLALSHGILAEPSKLGASDSRQYYGIRRVSNTGGVATTPGTPTITTEVKTEPPAGR